MLNDAHYIQMCIALWKLQTHERETTLSNMGGMYHCKHGEYSTHTGFQCNGCDAEPKLTVTTGYLIRQVYSDGSQHPVGRRRTIRRAVDLRNSLASHYGNHFKIVRLYRKVRASK
jgi:hypothetical protein